jgi:predicted phosphodiesterase
MPTRVLVMGDNHGDTESLRRVLDDIDGEGVDVAVHVGDFTRAWRESRQRDDEQKGKQIGAEQLREVEPVLADIDAQTRHGLVWVYGNQDYFGDLGYDLSVGTEVPEDGTVTAGGLRFTNSPDDVESDVILVTHMETWSLVDHFDGKAHFCGNTHRGRHKGRRLNASFLKLQDPETGTKQFGGYFLVEFDGPDTMDVEMRPIGDLERQECDRHRERGVQFQPPSRPCMFCEDHRVLMREMSASAYYGLTADAERDTVTRTELVDYAVGLWDDPPGGLRSEFATYLDAVDEDRYAPLTGTDDGLLTLAEKSYAY